MAESTVDPFGLSNRRRRVPTPVMDVYMSPAVVKVKRGDDMASDAMTTPVTNSKAPASPWNVSRISPQEETVSILSAEEEIHKYQRFSLDASTTSSVAASQSMRKQLLQLVTSLQANLNDAQKERDKQQEKILAQERELQHAHSQVKQLEGQNQDFVESYQRKQIEQQEQLQASHQSESECKLKLERALEQLSSIESERKQAVLALEQIREENKDLRARVEESEGGSNDFLSAQQKLEREQHALRERELAFAEREEEWRQHRQELEQRESQLAYAQSRLAAQTENVSRERDQVKSLQQQLMNLQTTQMDLETTHVEEEERLAEAAEELDKLQRDLIEQKAAFQTERQEHERALSEQKKQMDHLDLKFTRHRQDIMTQQAQLEGWEETLQARQLQLETETKKLAQKEALLTQKVQALERVESNLAEKDEELEQRSHSYDAKLLLTQQALDELKSHRQAEERRLDVATNNLEETELQTQKIRADAKTVREALKAKMGKAHQEFERIQIEIATRKNELEEIKSRLKLFVEEDCKSRAVAVAESTQYQAKLSSLKDEKKQLKAAINEMDAQLREMKVEHDVVVRRIADDQVKWEQVRRQSEIDEKEKSRKRHLESEAKISAVQQAAKEELTKLTHGLAKQQDEVAEELIHRYEQLDKMRLALDETTKSLQLREERIREEEDECQAQRCRLDRMLSQLDNASETVKSRREEMSWELERLQSLLETERRGHEKEVRALTARHDELLEKLREDHRDDLKVLADRMEASEVAKSKLDLDYTKIIAGLENQHKMLTSKLNSLLEEKSILEEQLALSRNRAETAEVELDRVVKDRDRSATTAETKEREEVHALMERLELNGSKLEVKQQAIVKQEQLLEEKKRQIQEQFEVLQIAGEEFKERLAVLRSKESEFTSRNMEFQRMVLEAETKRAKLQSAARQAAIQGMIQKSWREDQEAVSAAFSKWIRITMLYDDEREVISFQSAKTGFDVAMAELDAGREELDNSRLLLQEREKRIEEKERDVEVLKKDAEKQAEALRLAKDKLDCDISRLLEEKKSFLGNQAIKMTELEKERERLEKDRATLAQLDKFLLMKGKKLDSREKAIEVSQGSLSVDSSKQLSIALEKTINEERKVVDKAAKVVAERELDLQKLQTALGETENRLHVRESQLRIEACEYHEAHDRIKRLAEQLREKEGLLNKKEAELSNSMSECRTAQTRVHVLAQQLKQKDEDLANERRALAARCKECDECEVQLSVWQRELDDTAETLRLQERTK